MFLQILLKFLDYHKRTRLLKIVIILFVIWLYAIISGLSPSVVRASLMFSLISIGGSLQRDISSFNILSLAAFVMLLISPMQVFDVGFQLSFLAVFGILYFQPMFDRWYSPKNKPGKYVYQLFTVSISAQLATFPLTLFYFNQFPLYFWLANLLVIPLSFVVLILALFYIFLSGIPYLGVAIGWILNTITSVMNGWIHRVESIPGAVIGDISVHGSTVVLFFVIILLLFSWFQKPKFYKLFSLIVIFIFLSVQGAYRNYNSENRNEVYVLNVPKSTLIAVCSQSQNCFYGDYKTDSVPAGTQSLLHKVSLKLGMNGSCRYVRLDRCPVKLHGVLPDKISINTIDFDSCPKILVFETS